ALCPMPYALCPMPYALCPMPYAHEYLIFLRKAINQLLNLRPYHQCYTILDLAQNGAKYQFKTRFF
ncbi:hypothetical protein, partial [Microcoleus sp.]|uniref:hypothetical protein n=1 Tax=Microcoleus sp. TaxID=44472 RepID=UPI00403E8C32